MFVDSVMQWWNDWGLRISVLGSLEAYVFLGLVSGIRRRSAGSGLPWQMFQWVLERSLWTMYQLAELLAANALGNLSLCDADANASGEKQLLVAFWAPFLLLHLGGPDNLSAYTLEDNMLSLRKMAEASLQLFGVMYAIWTYIYRGSGHTHSRHMFLASVIIFFEGTAKYCERVYTQWTTNLEKMQEDHSSKEEPPAAAEPGAGSSSSSGAAAVKSKIATYEDRDLDDGDALLLAQDLYEVWRRFLVDASVHQGSPWQRANEELLSLPWEKMCTVVEMELSLMYEVLYTKATRAHTWAGYLIRFLSPACNAAAAALFCLRSLHRDRGRVASSASSFVGITYLLLGTAFALDVVWLLRALGSTWTYAYLKKKLAPPPPPRRRPWPCAWLHHQVLCGDGWWRRLHRFVVYLDPMRLFSGRSFDGPVDYYSNRRWSGTIGRYDLLRECTAPRRPWRRWLGTRLELQDKEYLSELPREVKQLVFERVQSILPRTTSDPDRYTMVQITTGWGHEAIRRAAEATSLFWNQDQDEEPRLGREFEQDVLVWYMGTSIFLSRGKVRRMISESSKAAGHARAIEAMSEYLMFLVAERRQMLPGLVLHSQLEGTRRALEAIWGGGGVPNKGRRRLDASAAKDRLIQLVQQKRRDRNRFWLEPADSDSLRLVVDAAEVAAALTKGSLWQRQVAPMLELIFNVWVDKLVYAAVRCGRESHAKQLSRGGELTTLLWTVIQHAGPFRIGEKKPDEEEKQPPMPEDDAVSKAYIPPDILRELGEELDPEDAQDSELPIRYVTLY